MGKRIDPNKQEYYKTQYTLTGKEFWRIRAKQAKCMKKNGRNRMNRFLRESMRSLSFDDLGYESDCEFSFTPSVDNKFYIKRNEKRIDEMIKTFNEVL